MRCIVRSLWWKEVLGVAFKAAWFAIPQRG